MIFNGALTAQQRTLLFIKPSLQSHQIRTLNPIGRPFGESRESFNTYISTQIKLPVIKPISIQEMPFFCMMECRVRKQANIWIKLRAGDDASYMKMIGSNVMERR